MPAESDCVRGDPEKLKDSIVKLYIHDRKKLKYVVEHFRKEKIILTYVYFLFVLTFYPPCLTCG